MRTGWAIGLLGLWSCWAQESRIIPAEIQADLQGQLPGDGDRPPIANEWGRFPRSTAVSIPAPGAAPPALTEAWISVTRLRHKIPKAARKPLARANKFLKAGNHSGAAAELEETVRRDPEFADAYGQLGVEHTYLGRLEAARADFQRAIELDPDLWLAHYDLAILLYRTGDAAGAEQNLRRALETASEDARVHFFLGCLLSQRADTLADGLRHVRYAARTLPEAKQVLRLIGER